jgi:hypothetical protein
MENNQRNERTAISQAEFDKKVEIEFCNLEYFEYMGKQEAWKKAVHVISSQYTVNQKSV